MEKMLSKGLRSPRKGLPMAKRKRLNQKKVEYYWIILKVKSKYSRVHTDMNKPVRRTGNSSMHKHFRSSTPHVRAVQSDFLLKRHNMEGGKKRVTSQWRDLTNAISAGDQGQCQWRRVTLIACSLDVIR